MTYHNYEFTAFAESDLTSGDIQCGVSFTMPASASTCISVSDNDSYLSGDYGGNCNDHATDHSGQHASIEGANGEMGNGGQIYAEKYHWVHDQYGNWYVMIEIEQEGSNDDYFAFYTGYGYTTPPAGAELTVGSSCNVSGNWIDFKCLDAGEKTDPNTAPDAVDDCFFYAEDEAGGVYDGNNLLANDTDADGDALHITAVNGQAIGDGKWIELDKGWIFVNKNGSIDFNANGEFDHLKAGETEEITFMYDISDGKGGQDWAKATIKVEGKSEPGSISGRVFCDTDCDGLDGTTTVIEGCDYTIEAENMHSWGFKTVGGSQASGDCLVKLKCAGGEGDLSTTFNGKDGIYDFNLRVQDENDGQSSIMVKVNGVLVDTIVLDHDNNGGGSNNGGFSTFTIADLELNEGDTIQLWADGDQGEFVRIDKIDLIGQDQTVGSAEPGKEGVTVKLVDLDGNVVDTTETDADGNYEFATVPVGDYKIMVVNPDGTEFTLQDAGSDDTIDSDVDGNGMSGVISVGEAEAVTDVDAGLKEVETGSLSGRYFCDDDKDATENDGNGGFDAGVANATVWLLDASGAIVGTTTTNANGDYRFDDLDAGEYSVRFEDPADVAGAESKQFVEAGVGAEGEDSDVESIGGAGNGNTGSVTVVAGEETMNVDAGIEDKPGALSGRYFCDEDQDGTENDGNGGFDAGIAGATVWLLDAAGNVVGTTTTNDTGDYRFDDLDAGQYSVRFEDPNDVAGAEGKTFIAAGVGAEGEDSDVESVGGAGNGNTGSVTVVAGEETMNVDAGIEDPGNASLAGRVFIDSNDDDDDDNNGDEAGVGSVTVMLIDGNGDVIATTDTNPDGTYEFNGLDAGDYTVMFDTNDADLGGRVLVDQDEGVDDTSDSDVGNDGKAPTVTLGIGDRVEDIDMGVEDPGTAELRGRVFEDTDDDNDDDGNGNEPAISGVTVELLDENGDVIGTTDTDDMGNYAFTGLDAGDYSVRFPSAVGGLVLIDPNAGASDASDSDAVDNGDGTAQTGVISLAIGEVSIDNDAGLENTNDDPTAGDDEFMTCADEVATFNLLDGDTDPNGDTLSVVSIMDEDEMAGVGESITLESGAVVTLNADGTVSYDGTTALAGLELGKTAVDEFKYTIEDGNGGSDDGMVETTACGALNTVETISAALPAVGCATYFFPAAADESYTVAIEGTGALGEVQADGSVGMDGTFNGWCIDFNGKVAYDLKQNGDFYSSTNADDLAALATNGLVEDINKLDEINWILNNQDSILANPDYDVLDVQNAIWALTDPSSFTADPGSDGEAIAMEAMANDGYVPGAGGVYGVVFAPTDLVDGERGQTFIIAVPWDELEQDCVC